MNAEDISGILICLLAAICLTLVLYAVKKITNTLPEPATVKNKMFRNTVIGILLWVGLLGVLALIGVFAEISLPPRPMLAAVSALLFLFALSFTPRCKALLLATPLHWMITFQAFRIGVELWFWYSYQTGVFPKIMTFEGANWDIVAGVLAIPAGLAVKHRIGSHRAIAILYNIIGFMILGNTLRSATLSIPSPIQQYAFDERILQLGKFPFIYLPGVLVVLAFGFHLLSLRQLYLRRSDPAKAASPLEQAALR